MRRQPNPKRGAFVLPWILLASTTGGILGGEPASGASATACLQLQARPTAFRTLGCTKFVYVRNSCAVGVVAELRRTQHLFSGTMRDVFPVVIPAGTEQSVDCAWWSGAMTPSQHELLAAWFFTPPTLPESQEHCSTQR